MRFLVKPILWVFTFHMATSGGIYAQENPVVIERLLGLYWVG